MSVDDSIPIPSCPRCGDPLTTGCRPAAGVCVVDPERCDQRVQDADDRWWQCISAAGHDGYHWYDDWRS